MASEDSAEMLALLDVIAPFASALADENHPWNDLMGVLVAAIRRLLSCKLDAILPHSPYIVHLLFVDSGL